MRQLVNDDLVVIVEADPHVRLGQRQHGMGSVTRSMDVRARLYLAISLIMPLTVSRNGSSDAVKNDPSGAPIASSPSLIANSIGFGASLPAMPGGPR